MGLGQLVSQPGIQPFGIAALVLFLLVFIAIVARTLTRPASEIARQARLPLEGEAGPEPTDAAAAGPTPSTAPRE